MKLVWHPLAMADRECIMDFIARDKPLAALALDENFETHADRIEANPYCAKPAAEASVTPIRGKRKTSKRSG